MAFHGCRRCLPYTPSGLPMHGRTPRKGVLAPGRTMLRRTHRAAFLGGRLQQVVSMCKVTQRMCFLKKWFAPDVKEHQSLSVAILLLESRNDFDGVIMPLSSFTMLSSCLCFRLAPQAACGCARAGPQRSTGRAWQRWDAALLAMSTTAAQVLSRRGKSSANVKVRLRLVVSRSGL